MKKFLSILITCLMLTMTFGTLLVSADTTSNLIFDLDFATLKDTTGNGYIDVSYNESGNGGAYTDTTIPDVLTFKNTNGNKIPYMEFDGATQKKSFIKVKPNSNKSSTYYTHLLESSFEMWVRMDDVANANWLNMFGICRDDTSDNSNGVLSLDLAEGKLALGLSTLTKYGDVSSVSDEWAHLVITRKLTQYQSSTTIKNVETNIYLNGNSTPVISHSNTYEVFPEKALFVMFGSAGGWSNGLFNGGLAEFKIYDKILSTDEISANYSAEVSDFEASTEESEESELIFDLDFETLKDTTQNGYIEATYNESGTAGGIYTATIPDVLNYTNKNGETIPYMEFEGTTPEKNFIKIRPAVYNASNMYTQARNSTFEMWVRMDDIANASWQNFMGICPDDGSDNASGTLPLDINEGQLVLSLGTGFTKYMDISAHSDKWAQLTITRTITDTNVEANKTVDVNIYINGSLIGSYTNTIGGYLSPSKVEYIMFGAPSPWTGAIFNGGLAEFKIYNKVLTEDEVAANFAQDAEKYDLEVPEPEEETNLIFDLDFATKKDLTGNGYIDVSYNESGNGGAYTDAVVPDIMTYTNKKGEEVSYMEFDGATQKKSFIKVKPNSNKSSTYYTHLLESSFEMWVRMDDVANANWLNMFGICPDDTSDNSNGVLSLDLAEGKLALGLSTLTAYGDVSSVSDEWAHLVITRKLTQYQSSTTMKNVETNIYLNGNSTPVISHSNTYEVFPEKALFVMFGSAGGWSNGLFNGGLAEFKIYNKILAKEEIASLYEAEKDSYAAKGIFEVTNVSFLDEDESPLPSLSGLEKATVYVTADFENNDITTKKYFMAAALYEGNKLVDVMTTNGSVQVGKPGSNYITLEGVTAKENSYIKLFVWSEDEGEEMKPYKAADESVSFVLPYSL